MTKNDKEIEILRKTAERIDGMIADLKNKKNEIDALIGELSELPKERPEEKREEVEPPKFCPLAKNDFLRWQLLRTGGDDPQIREMFASGYDDPDLLFAALERFWNEQKEPYPFALSVSETTYGDLLDWMLEREGSPIKYVAAVSGADYRDLWDEDFFEMHDDAEERLAGEKLKIATLGKWIWKRYDSDFIDAVLRYFKRHKEKIDEEFKRDGCPITYRDTLKWEYFRTHRGLFKRVSDEVDDEVRDAGFDVYLNYRYVEDILDSALRVYRDNPKLIDEEFERLGSPISYQEFLDWELYRSYVEPGDIDSDEYMSGLKVANKFNNDDAFSYAMTEYFNRHPELTDEDD